MKNRYTVQYCDLLINFNFKLFCVTFSILVDHYRLTVNLEQTPSVSISSCLLSCVASNHNLVLGPQENCSNIWFFSREFRNFSTNGRHPPVKKKSVEPETHCSCRICSEKASNSNAERPTINRALRLKSKIF